VDDGDGGYVTEVEGSIVHIMPRGGWPSGPGTLLVDLAATTAIIGLDGAPRGTATLRPVPMVKTVMNN
jgi:hypothetical protein